MLRSGNLFYKSSTKSSVLTIGDIRSATHGLLLDASVLKTAKSKGKRLQVRVNYITSPPTLCPVIALRKLRREKGHRKSAALFCYRDKNVIKPLSPSKFNTLLRSSLAKAGYDNKDYCAHSFRRGAATFAAGVGVNLAVVKIQGNWRSECFCQYMTCDSAYRHEFANQMTVALSSLA